MCYGSLPISAHRLTYPHAKRAQILYAPYRARLLKYYPSSSTRTALRNAAPPRSEPPQYFSATIDTRVKIMPYFTSPSHIIYRIESADNDIGLQHISNPYSFTVHAPSNLSTHVCAAPVPIPCPP
jgi:hypothetical protein